MAGGALADGIAERNVAESDDADIAEVRIPEQCER